MDFAKIKEMIADFVAMIKEATKVLREFIDGFKKDIDFTLPE